MNLRLIEIADQLNELLNIDTLDKSTLLELGNELDQILDLRFKLVDFQKYNENELNKIIVAKLTQIKEQNFEKAANLREQEKECIKYANFQKYFNSGYSRKK